MMKESQSSLALVGMMRTHLRSLSMGERFAYAVRLLWGAPYKWGKETILGTDCSGSVAWGLYLLGYNVRVRAVDLYKDLTTSLPGEPVAGDLCFFWDKELTKIQHVVVYSDELTIMDADKRFMDTPLWKEIENRQHTKFANRRLDWPEVQAASYSGKFAWDIDEELKPLFGIFEL